MTLPSTVPRLAGRVAFITGAARGQGRSHALTLAAEGATIIGVDICSQIDTVPFAMATEADLQETVELVEGLGGTMLARKADVRDVVALRAVVADGMTQFGRLDIVVANAGIGGFRPTPGAPPEVLQKEFDAVRRDVISVNQDGVYNTIVAAKQALIDSGGSSIVVTSSLAGLRPLGAGPGYTEAKTGILGLMRSTAIELAPHLIRCNAVCPTNVATPFIQNEYWARQFRPDLPNPTWQEAAEAFSVINLMPVPWIEPKDVSKAVLFLASDDSRYITGVALPIDAGALLK